MNLDRCLFWDCETRSTIDLRKTGAYIYAVHPSTSVTVARLAIGKEPPVEWRPGWPLEDRFVQAMLDPLFEIVAHNAAFERLMLQHILHPRHGWPLIAIDRWVCTMARARAQALPGALDGAANAAGLDVAKDQPGYALMLRMCRPRSVNPDGTVVWWTDEERMARLSVYCEMDVKVERALYQATAPLPPPEAEIWDMTERMNDRGVRFDLSFVRAARVVAEDTRLLLDNEMRARTYGAVDRASKVEDLKRWLRDRGVDMSPPPELVRGPVASVLGRIDREKAAMFHDLDDEVEDEEEAEDVMPELRRRDVIRLIADPRVGDIERGALNVRLEAGKISTRKLDAILHRADPDGFVRGLLGYHGANTGRYISMGLQVQNFPRDVTNDWDGMRALLDDGAEVVDALAGPPLSVISRMLRGAIIARDGFEVATGDFSSVEAVGLAWLAGQTDLLDAFRAKRKIYEEMAARVYNMRVEDIAQDSIHRQIGKCLTLGSGYQMGWWKFRETCLVQAGVLLSPEEANHAIQTYREMFPEIPALWKDLHQAAVDAVRMPGSVTVAARGKIRFKQDAHWLRMRLPSGRFIWYNMPLIEEDKFGHDKVTYMAVNPKTRKWERTSTYGGRLTENCLSAGTMVLTNRGWRAIETVRLTDRLWDGEAWVRHAGLIAKGEQDIIEVDGVGLTPDHEVMTARGWSDGASCDGLDRAACRLPAGAVSLWQHEAGQGGVAGPLRLRVRTAGRGGRPPEGVEVLRLSDERPDFSAPYDARDVEAPGLRGLAQHGGSLSVAYASGVEELRRPGRHGLPRVASGLRRILGRHGPNVSNRADPGAPRQHAGVFGGELRLGHAQGELAQHAALAVDRYSMGSDDNSRSGGTQRHQRDYVALPFGGGRALVFDILDAGPRHRFVVAGATGPLIVHNCVQGLCRDLLVERALALESENYNPVTLVHDEVIAEPERGHGSIGEMCEIMSAAPPWAAGFALSAKGARGPRYLKT